MQSAEVVKTTPKARIHMYGTKDLITSTDMRWQTKMAHARTVDMRFLVSRFLFRPHQ